MGVRVSPKPSSFEIELNNIFLHNGEPEKLREPVLPTLELDCVGVRVSPKPSSFQN